MDARPDEERKTFKEEVQGEVKDDRTTHQLKDPVSSCPSLSSGQDLTGQQEEEPEAGRFLKMESQASSLLQRIHRLQGRQTQRHLHKHITSFLRREQSLTGIGCQIQPMMRQPANHHLHRSTVPFNSHVLLNNHHHHHHHPSSPASNSSSPLKDYHQSHVNAVKNDRISKGLDNNLHQNHHVFHSKGIPVPKTSSSLKFSASNINNNNNNLTNNNERDGSSFGASLNSDEAPSLMKLLRTHDVSSLTSSLVIPPSSSCDLHVANNVSVSSQADPSVQSILRQHPSQNDAQSQSDKKRLEEVIPCDAETLECHAGQLRSNLEHLEEDYDSDATESSSGGESVDEFAFNLLTEEDNLLNNNVSHPQSPVPTSNKKHVSSSIRDTLSWKWSQERGSIACRWMWLVAQVADLEFKIRQQNDMYRSLRMTKGPLVLEARSDSDTFVVNNKQESDNKTDKVSQEEDQQKETESYQCVRTMPIKNFRQRKLVRSSIALTGATRRNARYSTVHCSCRSMSSLVSPCVLCNGRNSYVVVVDTDCMPETERMSILDPSCHPVLSLPSQVSLGLHFSKFLKKETGNRSLAIKRQLDRNRSKGRLSSPTNTSNNNNNVSHSKNNIRMRMKSLGGNNINNDLSRRKKSLNHSSNRFGSKFGGKKSVKFGQRERHESHCSNGSIESEWNVSPSLPVKRRRRSDMQDAYDINNIVVDYSIASTTRVEKLQYKEILTPKWREIDFASHHESKECKEPEQETDKEVNSHKESNGSMNGNANGMDSVSELDLLEDLSDSAFSERHARFEEEERKRRFLTFMTRPRRESTRDGEEDRTNMSIPSTPVTTSTPSLPESAVKSIQSPLSSSLSVSSVPVTPTSSQSTV